ncbi:MAG: BON domain-containing protein [Bryobacteraceae bacterium]
MSHFLSSVRLFILLFLVLGVIPAALPGKSPAAPARTARAGLSDDALAAAIRARFAKSKINADHFQVRVEGGVAIIEGKTGVIQRKGTATRLAKLAGAKAVRNNIEVSEAARAKARGTLQEGRRRAQVRRDEGR